MSNSNVTENKSVRRRGIASVSATSQLKFHERDAAPNGLFIGHLEEVTVDWRTLSDDTKGLQSFAGLAIPRLTFHFASNHAKSERRHYYHNILPVESNIDTIEGGAKEWQVKNLFRWCKHFLEVFYLKGRDFTEEEIDALELPFIDFDENGEYVAVEPEDVINGYKIVFENVAAMLNGTFNLKDGETAKPCYFNANGTPINIWIKLLRAKKGKKGWTNVNGGELGFDPFIGEGVIEIQKTNTPPTRLFIDLSKESTTPKEVDKAPNVGVSMPGMPGMAGVTIPSNPLTGGSENAAFAAAGEQSPF